jgi:hypothetical protein
VIEPDFDTLEEIEEHLATLPLRVDLASAELEMFRSRRARIHQRYNEWRRGMPGLDELFEDDNHRAKALAGSLATELDRTLELYGGMADAAGQSATGAWAAEWAHDWVESAEGLAEAWHWGPEARSMFSVVLEDLSEQAVARAEAGERPRSARPEVRVSRSRRLAIMLGRLVERFFRPAPRRP